ncbi:MAG: hypothetical protein GY804_14255 [Alphaproteobacteria bacterium]|nr:hypothetical protein [Alphaproteobacteria bacterium]
MKKTETPTKNSFAKVVKTGKKALASGLTLTMLVTAPVLTGCVASSSKVMTNSIERSSKNSGNKAIKKTRNGINKTIDGLGKGDGGEQNPLFKIGGDILRDAGKAGVNDFFKKWKIR